MITKSEVFSYEEFVKANAEKRVGELEYIHGIFKLANLPLDIVFALASLFSPKLDIEDGRLFLSERFDRDKYFQYLSEGKSKRESQLWLNLIEISGIFEDMDFDLAIQLGNLISDMWNAKIKCNGMENFGHARVIIEEEYGEVFVTID